MPGWIVLQYERTYNTELTLRSWLVLSNRFHFSRSTALSAWLLLSTQLCRPNNLRPGHISKRLPPSELQSCRPWVLLPRHRHDCTASLSCRLVLCRLLNCYTYELSYWYILEYSRLNSSFRLLVSTIWNLHGLSRLNHNLSCHTMS